MKRLLLILILTLRFQSWTKADDIRDFDIEGMSIGDSALNFFSKNELNNALEIFDYKDNKYRYYFLSFSKGKTYEALQITVKPEDKNFIIHGIDGNIAYEKNINDCYKKKKEVKKEINDFFGKSGIDDSGSHPMDKTGKSKYSRTSYKFDDGGFVEIICYDMSKKLEKKGKHDRFAITLKTKQFLKFLTYEAY